MTTRLAKQNTKRALDTWLNNKDSLTPDERMDQMYLAHRLRNYVFGVNAPQLDGDGSATVRFQGVAIGKSPVFANDLIITDMVGSVGLFTLNTVPSMGLQVNAIGVPGVSVDDFFGAGQFLPTMYVCDQTPQTGRYSPNDDDTSFKALEFVPRLLPKGQQVQCRWAVDSPLGLGQGEFGGEQIVFQSVFALCANEPYACPLDVIVKKCQHHVNTLPREYFVLDLTIPFASLPTLNNTRAYVTAPQDRPLLVYGMTSNLTGCQIELRDDSKQHIFTAMAGLAPNGVIIEGDGTEFPGPLPNFQANPILLPIWGIAPDSTQNANVIPDAWRYWPVPHFLEPGASFTIRLRAGLRDAVQVISTTGATVNETNPAHIAFACLTL